MLAKMIAIEDYFKALADATRLRIMNLLTEAELCGCDLQQLLDIPQSNVSRHLVYLKRAGLVEARRDGYRVRYRILENRKPEYAAVVGCLQACLSDEVFLSDRKRLNRATMKASCSAAPRHFSDSSTKQCRTGIEAKGQ